MRMVAVLLCVACGSPAPTCKDALAHAKMNLDAAVRVCESNHWSADVRRCLGTAPDPRAVKHCLEPVELDLAAIYREQSDQLARAAKLEALTTQFDELAAQAEAASNAVKNAKSNAERATAQAKLDQVLHQVADFESKVAAARQSVDAAHEPADSGSAR